MARIGGQNDGKRRQTTVESKTYNLRAESERRKVANFGDNFHYYGHRKRTNRRQKAVPKRSESTTTAVVDRRPVIETEIVVTLERGKHANIRLRISGCGQTAVEVCRAVDERDGDSRRLVVCGRIAAKPVIKDV